MFVLEKGKNEQKRAPKAIDCHFSGILPVQVISRAWA